jgi:hypothetical protein
MQWPARAVAVAVPCCGHLRDGLAWFMTLRFFTERKVAYRRLPLIRATWQ